MKGVKGGFAPVHAQSLLMREATCPTEFTLFRTWAPFNVRKTSLVSASARFTPTMHPPAISRDDRVRARVSFAGFAEGLCQAWMMLHSKRSCFEYPSSRKTSTAE